MAIFDVAGCNSGVSSTTGNGGLNCGQSGRVTALVGVEAVECAFDGFADLGLGIARF